MDGLLSAVSDALGAVLVTLGLLACTAGVARLLRAPETMVGVQAASGAILPGTLLVLLGVLVSAADRFSARAALVLLFLAATGPVSAHALARAAHLPRRRKADAEDAGPPGPDGS